MKHAVLFHLIPALAAAVLGSGCVAIPMGSETYRHEYPTDIHPTADPPKTTYGARPAVSAIDEDKRSVAIGILGEITTEQARVQEFAGVEVVKKKRVAIGLFPTWAKDFYHPKDALTPISGSMYYLGDGKYSSSNWNAKEPVGEMDGGRILLSLSLGLLPTPFSMMAGIFGPFEKDYHFLGGTMSSSRSFNGFNTHYETRTYQTDDIDLLLKFPMSEREKIGAWTYHENTTHPHNTFWHGFEAQWVGVYKYCNYFVKDLGTVSKTAPAAPNITTREKTMTGPYEVVFSLPSLGFAETSNVEPGETTATFNLLDAANGDSSANGTVRFLPPSGGLAAVRNEDDRAILELAMEREWPVTVALPAPRLDKVARPDEGGTARPEAAPYRIASIGRTGDGKGLVVRVTVNDTSKTFEIDRAVQPEVRRMFREQFATGENAGRRESVAWKTEDDGKTLVYTATFE